MFVARLFFKIYEAFDFLQFLNTILTQRFKGGLGNRPPCHARRAGIGP